MQNPALRGQDSNTAYGGISAAPQPQARIL